MRVIHVVWSFRYGGIETMLINIINTQAQLGAKVALIIINDNIEPILTDKLSSEITIIKLKRKISSKSFKFISQLNQAINHYNADIVHLHSSKLIGMLNHSLQKKAVCTLHAIAHGKIHNKYFPKFITKAFPLLNQWGTDGNIGNLNLFSKVFAISKSVKESLDKKGIISRIIYNGILPENFKLRALEIPKQDFKIVQIGRILYSTKGQDIALKALSLLPEKFTIDFIGDGKDIDYLKELSRKLGIEKRVNWLGEKSPTFIAENLCKYDLFLMPSRDEGFGLTVAEAMAAQLPVIVSSGEGPEEITKGKKYGWTFENLDPKSLAIQIELIASNYEPALEKARLGLTHIKNNFDVRITAKQYLEAYKN